jgi:hypothetical protein
MKNTKKTPAQQSEKQGSSKEDTYYDGQKGWLPIAGYRREGVKKQTRKG